MTIGKKIHERRKEIGISAEKLAEIIGVSPATIYRYENGDIGKIPADRLNEIAVALCTTHYELTGAYTYEELIDIGLAGAKTWANDFRFSKEQKEKLAEYMAEYTMRLKQTINVMADSAHLGEIALTPKLITAVKDMQNWSGNILSYVTSDYSIKIAPGDDAYTEDEIMILSLFRLIPPDFRKLFLEQGRVFAESLKKD